MQGQEQLFRWIIKRGLNDVNDNCVNGMSPLFLATDYAGVDMVKAVLAAGGDVGCRTVDGWTPLHAATRLGNVRMIRALLRAGSDPASPGQKSRCFCVSPVRFFLLRRQRSRSNVSYLRTPCLLQRSFEGRLLWQTYVLFPAAEEKAVVRSPHSASCQRSFLMASGVYRSSLSVGVVRDFAAFSSA